MNIYPSIACFDSCDYTKDGIGAANNNLNPARSNLFAQKGKKSYLDSLLNKPGGTFFASAVPNEELKPLPAQQNISN